MPQVEYKTVVQTFGFMGAGKGKINRKVLEQQLAQLGEEGWELVHVWFDQSLDGEKDGHLLLFKRVRS